MSQVVAMENDERTEVASVQRVHHAFNVACVELFEGVELLTSREGSVWSEGGEERRRAMRSML